MEQAVARRPRRDLSGYAALIVAVTGLGTALWRKPPEEAAKAGYIELTTAIIETQTAEKQNHDDILALRGYLDSYTRDHTVVQTPVPVTSSTAPQGAWTALPLYPPKPPAVIRVTAPASATPPPTIAPQAVPKRIKEADSIAW